MAMVTDRCASEEKITTMPDVRKEKKEEKRRMGIRSKRGWRIMKMRNTPTYNVYREIYTADD